MPFETIRTEIGPPGVALLTLHRPEKMNAISIRMRREISECLRAWREDPSVRAVILTGAGRAFSAGFDLEEFTHPELHEEILASSARYHRDVWHFPKLVIAAVNGAAVGGGFDLAALCDMRLASDAAWFAHPEAKHGAPPLFTPLRWIVGDAVARDICFTRRRLGAMDAALLNLVRDVKPAIELLQAARDLAALCLEAPQETLRYLKERISASPGQSFEAAFREEHDRAFREVLLRPGRWSATAAG